MPQFDLSRRLAAELLGTALLLATVVGSGIMGAQLSGGNIALALLGNTLATGAMLVVLILIFGPIFGAHFNPVVTLVFALRKELHWLTALAFMAVQMFGAIAGVYAAHLMFSEPVLQISSKLRDGPAQAFSEFIATSRAHWHDLGHSTFPSGNNSNRCRPLYHRRILVYGINLLCEPSGHGCPKLVEYICWDSAGVDTGIHCSSVRRSDRRICTLQLVTLAQGDVGPGNSKLVDQLL